jgi:hypothetical protein
VVLIDVNALTAEEGKLRAQRAPRSGIAVMRTKPRHNIGASAGTGDWRRP